MNTSLRRCALFILPYLIVLACVAILSNCSGEFTKTEAVVNRLVEGQSFVFGPALSNRDYDFQLQAAKALRPEVLVLGTSRMAGWRSAMFRPYHFYNGGTSIYDIKDYERFLSSLGPPYPKVVILSIDWYHLCPGSSNRIPTYVPWEQNIENINNVAKALYESLKNAPMRAISALTHVYDPIRGLPAIGLNARQHGVGFRNDGSWQFGNHLLDKFRDLDNDEWIKMVRNGINVWGETDQFDDEKFIQLASLSKFAQANGIVLYSVAMPLDPIMVTAYNLHPKMITWRYFQKHGETLLDRYGITHFTFYDTNSIDGKGDEFFDGVHPSETAYVRSLLKMIENPKFSAALPLLDEKMLIEKLKRADRLEAYRDDH